MPPRKRVHKQANSKQLQTTEAIANAATNLPGLEALANLDLEQLPGACCERKASAGSSAPLEPLLDAFGISVGSLSSSRSPSSRSGNTLVSRPLRTSRGFMGYDDEDEEGTHWSSVLFPLSKMKRK
eukprot:tig00000227_g19792.t1